MAMTESNMPKISVEEIMSRIKTEVQKRKGNAVSVDNKVCSNIPVTNTLIPTPLNLNISSETPFIHKDQYEVPDFIKYSDLSFIRNVYRAVLKREPDHIGIDIYLKLLRTGQLSKTEILSMIRFSKEGRIYNVKILGIKKRYFLTLIYKIPLIGYLAKTLLTIFTLPLLLKRLNQVENNFPINHKTETDNFVLLQDAVNQKANQSELTTKVDRSELETKVDRSELKTKADRSELEAKVNRGELEVKVNRSELEIKVNRSELETKADRSELETKADRSELETKADRSELETKVDRSELETKVDRSELETKVGQNEFQLYLQTVSYAKDYMKLVQSDMQELISEAKARLPQELNAEEVKQIINEGNHDLDALYVAFEDKFRGTTADIKNRLKIYVAYVEDALIATNNAPILDVGCGRGEWLSLMRDHKIKAIGIDLNRVMIEQSRKSGFDVIESDVIDYLNKQKSNSLSVITGFHIIEHLPFKVLIKLYDEALRVLKPGGIVIFETPNPENLIVGACNFYTDPTHINPLVPVSTQFLLKERGFHKVDVLRLHNYKAIPNINLESQFIIDNFSNEMDFSIIGYKI